MGLLVQIEYVRPALGICPSPDGSIKVDGFQQLCAGAMKGDSLKQLTDEMGRAGAKREFIGESYFFFRDHLPRGTETCEVAVDARELVISADYSSR